jgi:hypothetical protein
MYLLLAVATKVSHVTFCRCPLISTPFYLTLLDGNFRKKSNNWAHQRMESELIESQARAAKLIILFNHQTQIKIPSAQTAINSTGDVCVCVKI